MVKFTSLFNQKYLMILLLTEFLLYFVTFVALDYLILPSLFFVLAAP